MNKLLKVLPSWGDFFRKEITMNHKLLKRILCIALTLCLGFGCTACSGDSSSAGSTADDSSVSDSESAVDNSSSEADESSEEEIIPTTYEEYYEVMLKKSLVSVGNPNPMLDIMDRAKNGEEVTVAYIGGSITEGLTATPNTCYAKLSYEYFAENYGNGDNVKYVNAGLSGTPSILGTFRLERDVLQYNPDIVFIEFAVNDGSEGTYQGAYEGIIRTVYERNPKAAVVLLFARTADGYTAQDYMKQIGEYYKLPMISYADGLTYMFDNGQMEWKDFSSDQSHPNGNGHKVVRDIIAYYFDTVAKTERAEKDYKLTPIYLLSDTYVNCHLIEGDKLEADSLGSWKVGSTINTFTNGWTYEGSAGNNEPLVFSIEAKNLYLVFKENNTGNLGKVRCVITSEDGTVDEMPIDAITSGGWGNPTVKLLKISGKKQVYKVEIFMDEGNEDKLFEVLGFGYTL